MNSRWTTKVAAGDHGGRARGMTRHMRRKYWSIGLFVAAAMAAGCSGGSDDAGSAGSNSSTGGVTSGFGERRHRPRTIGTEPATTETSSDTDDTQVTADAVDTVTTEAGDSSVPRGVDGRRTTLGDRRLRLPVRPGSAPHVRDHAVRRRARRTRRRPDRRGVRRRLTDVRRRDARRRRRAIQGLDRRLPRMHERRRTRSRRAARRPARSCR